jgi:hypothetical protein
MSFADVDVKNLRAALSQLQEQLEELRGHL